MIGLLDIKFTKEIFTEKEFLAWLVSHKVLDKGAFDYEQLDQEQSLLVVNKLEGLNDNR